MGEIMKQFGLTMKLPLSYGPLAIMGKMLMACFLIFASIAKADERIDVLMLGDSLTHGYGLVAENGLVPQLQRYVNSQRDDVRLINAGVSGDTTAGGLERVAWSIEPGLDAAVVALGGNDVLRGIAPEVVRANLMGILDELQKAQVAFLVVGTHAPNNYGPDYKQQFDQIFPELAELYGALYIPSFFEPFITDGQLDQNAYQYFQPDGIHPNAAGVKMVVEAVGPIFLEMIATAASN
jgi:acyl-CoA thioesterase-1